MLTFGLGSSSFLSSLNLSFILLLSTSEGKSQSWESSSPPIPNPLLDNTYDFPSFFSLFMATLSSLNLSFLLLSTFSWWVTGLEALPHTGQNDSLSSFSLFKVTLSSLNLSILLLSTSKSQVTALEVLPPWNYPYTILHSCSLFMATSSFLNLPSILLQSTSNCQVKVLEAHPLSKTRQHLRFPFLILLIHGKFKLSQSVLYPTVYCQLPSHSLGASPPPLTTR